MNTWSKVIAKLVENQRHHNPEAEAKVLAKREYSNVKKQFETSELQLRELEATYNNAKSVLRALEEHTQSIEQDTQTALANDNERQAYTLALQIAQLNANLSGNRQQVAKLENTLNDLKGMLSQNRYSLFRLGQQLDTLNATTQLQQAQAHLALHNGVRTALDAIALLRTRAASNDDKTQEAEPTQNLPESPEAIIVRLKKGLD